MPDKNWVTIRIPESTRDDLRRIKDKYDYPAYWQFVQEAADLKLTHDDRDPTKEIESIVARMEGVQRQLEKTAEMLEDEEPPAKPDEGNDENS